MLPQTHDELKAVIWNICAPDTAKQREEHFKETLPIDNAVICAICGEPVESPQQPYCDKCRGFIEKRSVESEVESEMRVKNLLYAVAHGLAGRS